MAYCFVIKDRESYRPLDISNLPELIRASNLKKNITYSLEELDGFTSAFNDEIELRERLYNCGVLKGEEIKKELSIRRKTSSGLEKVRYGFIYKNNLKYLNANYLRMILLNKSNDIEFLKKLISFYRNSYTNNGTISQIRSVINGYYDSDLNIYNVLNNFYIREIFEIDKKTGETLLKYKAFHDLAMFVYNYEENLKEEKNPDAYNENKMIQRKKLDELSNKINKEQNAKIKKRVKKNEIEGQMSFADII